MKILGPLSLAAILWHFGSPAHAESKIQENFENDTVRRLWSDYVDLETIELNSSQRPIQSDCQPRFYPADHTSSPSRKGMVMFFHGFSACPQQYFKVAELLSQQGFDVFLPLSPGHGRMPDAQDIDYLDDLPSKKTAEKPYVHSRYAEFVKTMNEIAAASSGIRVIAGLSGGGGLASTAALMGQDDYDGKLWDRALLYAPYFKNPGPTQGLVDAVGFFNPGVKNDWGDSCRRNRSRPDGRDGYCAVTVGATIASVQLGDSAAQRFDQLNIPVQFVGVESDPTADNSAMVRAYQRAPEASFCFYPVGTPHSLINPEKDLLPDSIEYADIRDESLPSGPPYTWVPYLEQGSVDFITKGVWFPKKGISEIEAEFGHMIQMCHDFDI